eukprot:3362549-Amphidinium_carterae.1
MKLPKLMVSEQYSSVPSDYATDSSELVQGYDQAYRDMASPTTGQDIHLYWADQVRICIYRTRARYISTTGLVPKFSSALCLALSIACQGAQPSGSQGDRHYDGRIISSAGGCSRWGRNRGPC